jgi:hypothetical protein
MYVVNFFETFSTHYFNSPKQDRIFEFQKNKQKLMYTIYTRSGSFGMFFSKA